MSGLYVVVVENGTAIFGPFSTAHEADLWCEREWIGDSRRLREWHSIEPILTPVDAARQWIVTLPITRPLSLNDRQQRWAKAEATKALRTGTALLVRSAGVPTLKRIQVELHYAPRDKRRRDALNLVATLKAAEDGVVDAGVIPDDTAEFSVPTMPVIDPPTGTTGRLYLVIRELAA